MCLSWPEPIYLDRRIYKKLLKNIYARVEQGKVSAIQRQGIPPYVAVVAVLGEVSGRSICTSIFAG